MHDMRTFLNLSIKWKLVLGFSIGIVSLLLVAGTAVLSMTALRDTQTEIQEFQLANVIHYLALDANLSRAGRHADAEAAFDTGTEGYGVVNARVTEMAELAKENARFTVGRSISLVRRAVLALSVIALAAVLLSVLAIVALHRAIAVPVTGVAGAATRIAAGELELSTPWEDRQDEIGDLARAFNRMSVSLRNLADIADKIADGDLTIYVSPRSKSDRLAISFGIMSENLKGLTGEMKSGAREINAAAVEILEITREFVVEIADQDRARRFQDSLLRLEELSKRLDTVVGRLKLPAEA